MEIVIGSGLVLALLAVGGIALAAALCVVLLKLLFWIVILPIRLLLKGIAALIFLPLLLLKVVVGLVLFGILLPVLLVAGVLALVGAIVGVVLPAIPILLLIAFVWMLTKRSSQSLVPTR